jgi:hypothetical protein
MLYGVIGAGAAVVVALAVLTPTVIVGNDNPRVQTVRAVTPQAPTPAPAPAPAPKGRQGLPGLGPRPFRDLLTCLQQHGFGFGNRNRATPPDPQTMRDALRACRGTLPGMGSTP